MCKRRPKSDQSTRRKVPWQALVRIEMRDVCVCMHGGLQRVHFGSLGSMTCQSSLHPTTNVDTSAYTDLIPTRGHEYRRTAVLCTRCTVCDVFLHF
jgi:hypothetical protein